jgi:hypothetical protein
MNVYEVEYLAADGENLSYLYAARSHHEAARLCAYNALARDELTEAGDREDVRVREYGLPAGPGELVTRPVRHFTITLGCDPDGAVSTAGLAVEEVR